MNSEVSGFSDYENANVTFNNSADPNAMLSNHIAPEFVRQLDRTALKNCMELALLRHEKDVSVKQGN